MAAAPGAIRRGWVRVHRWAGLGMAGFLVVAGLTGALIAFADEIDAWLNPGLFFVEPRQQPGLSLEALSARVADEHPGLRVRRVFPPQEPGRSVRVSVLARPGQPGLDASELYLDPYDGRLLGSQQWRAWRWDRANAVPFVFRLHYTLYLPGRWGYWLLGIVAVVWLLDCPVGLYLTLPVRARARRAAAGPAWWRRWWSAWLVKRQGSLPRLSFDLHRASGLWLWGVLFLLALSSVCLNLREEVAEPLLRRVASVAPPVASRFPAEAPPGGRRLSYDQALALATARLGGAQADYVPRFVAYWPERQAYQVSLQAPGWRRAAFQVGEVQWFLDAATGALLFEAGYDAGGAADKFLALQYPIHSGAILGLAGRVLVAVAGLAVALLSVTGVMVWWIKRSARRRARPAASPGRPVARRPAASPGPR